MNLQLRPTLLALAGLLLLVPAPFAAAQSSRPDQVFQRRRGEVRPVAGELVSNQLDEVVIVGLDGDENKIDAEDVVLVQFNRVPQAFRDGKTLMAAGQLEQAAQMFAEAAGSSDSSAPVKAAARHREAQALLRLTATDPTQAAAATGAAERFLTDHDNNRELPAVRLLLGRAQWLAGDPAKAVETLSALLGEASGDRATTGYGLETCYRAGLLAAHAALAAGDASKAQELLGTVESGLTAAIGSLDPDDDRLSVLEAIRAEAQLGEGHALLADGKASQARSFFQARLDAGEVASERTAAQLGLGLALEQEGDLRRAQLEYAGVMASSTESGDTVAAALLGLARTATASGESGGRELARAWLEELRTRYGASLSAVEAHDLAQTL